MRERTLTLPINRGARQAAAADKSSFRQRLDRIAEGAGSYYALAKAAKINEETLRNYRVRGSEPSRPILIQLARAAGVSVSWLASGGTDIDHRRLRAAIEIVEQALTAEHRVIEADRRAAVIAAVYEILSEPGKTVNRRSVLSIVRAV
jgi:hypothetical protein